MKKNLPFITMLFALSANAQNVTIPDANFKAALVGNSSINTNSDSEIQLTEAAAYAGVINVPSLNISDLTGIEKFTAITGLDCAYNNLASVNVSSNTMLNSFQCGNNNLTSINIAANTLLTSFDCSVNQLSALNISSNTALRLLGCNNNSLTALNTAANTALTLCVCGFNNLNTLNFSSNTALSSLDCIYNQLSSLNVSSNTALITLNCSNNNLSSLTLSSTSTLRYLSCQMNQLSSLNVSANPGLQEIRCHNNQLTSLNIQNGNNTALTFFNATNNSSLSCIQVDNAAYMSTTWGSAKDAGAIYSTNCLLGLNEFYVSSFSETIFPNPSCGSFTVRLPDFKSEIELKVNDILGNCIYRTECTGKTEHNIDLGNWPEGVYFVEVSAGDKNFRTKIVRQ